MVVKVLKLITISVSILIATSSAFARAGLPQQSGGTKDRKTGSAPAPASLHDLSGTWEPADGPDEGVQGDGVIAMPDDGKPEHQLPYTPLGLQTLKSHKALVGADEVLPGFYNDPRDKCEPIGFPRTDFYNLRETQILQSEYKVAILYEYAEIWRVIWTDGRPVPKVVDGGVLVDKEVREPRYYGYSVGKWMNDTTLVVDTVGTMGDDRTWMDLAGRPVSDRLHVIEEFHRVNHNRLELTVTIDDPKMYTKPWIAMNKFPMKLEDPHRDVVEMYCSPIEMEKYNKLFGNPASGGDSHAPQR
jgi:hypothetical protein